MRFSNKAKILLNLRAFGMCTPQFLGAITNKDYRKYISELRTDNGMTISFSQGIYVLIHDNPFYEVRSAVENGMVRVLKPLPVTTVEKGEVSEEDVWEAPVSSRVPLDWILIGIILVLPVGFLAIK